MQNPYLKKAKPTREEIVLQYAPVVKHIANRLAARLPANFQVDDLIQVGMIGLLEAIEKFDSKRGIKFKTYAEIRVRGAMLDDLRSKDWIPRSVRDNANKLEKAYSELRAQNIDHPTDKQLAKQLEIKPKELDTFLSKSRSIPLVSLDSAKSMGYEDDDMDILETIAPDEEEDPISNIIDSEAKEQLVEALGKLPEKEQLVLSLYYNEDMNLKEIGAVLGITESRASQLRTKAIGMLRSYMKSYIETFD